MSHPVMRHKPSDIGKYILCSTARSFNGIILLVGKIDRKNHAHPSLIQIFPHFKTTKIMVIIRKIENNIFQSVANSVKGNPLSTLRLKGKINLFM
jgi:hypothetical protein|tara:strand:+ start:420 stop:704 length:285 start_codon:yes stop_codon:yes gene_type:complete